MRNSLRDVIMDENKNNEEPFEVVEGSEPNYNISEVKDNFLIDSHDLNLPENNKNIFVPKFSRPPVVKEEAKPPVNTPVNTTPAPQTEAPKNEPPAKPVEEKKAEPTPPAPSKDDINIEDLLSTISVDEDTKSEPEVPVIELEPPKTEEVKPPVIETPKVEETPRPVVEQPKVEEPKPVETQEPKAPITIDDEEFDANGIDNLLNTMLGLNNDNNNNDDSKK